MRLRPKVDANQTAVVKACRDMGATVQSLASIGAGCPDLLVGFQGRNHLMEVKNMDGRGDALTPDEQRWAFNWKGSAVAVIRSPLEARAYLAAFRFKGKT